MISPLNLAIMFHDTYESLAPNFGYETREETKQFSPETPNGQLMVAVCDRIINTLFKGPEPFITKSYSWDTITEWVEASFGIAKAIQFDEWIESYLEEWEYYDGGIINFNITEPQLNVIPSVPEIVNLVYSLFGDDKGFLTLYV